MRSYYLDDIPLDEAVRRFEDALESAGALSRTPVEALPLDRAHGRTTAGPVWAKSSSPHYDAAAMDGIAVRSRDTRGATETSPVRLSVDAEAVWLDTGDPMPDGFDAVVKIEVVHEIDESTIEIHAPAPPYQDVRPLGEDIVATELVLPTGHRLRPQDLAACAQAGLAEIEVRRAPASRDHPDRLGAGPCGRDSWARRHHRVELAHARRHGRGVGRRGDSA